MPPAALVIGLLIFGQGCDRAPDSITATYDVTTLQGPPPNDDFGAATTVAASPYSDAVDLTAATVENGEPTSSCWIWSGLAQKSAWYVFTPSQTGWFAVRALAAFSNVVAVYTGSALDNITEVGGGGGPGSGCNAFGQNVLFLGQANTSYYIQVHGWFDAGGLLDVHLDAVLPPSNDDFANAIPISALPFFGTTDITAAGLEPDEPLPSCGASATKTAWYAFTPDAAGSISASVNTNFAFPPVVAAYIGNAGNGVTEAGCRDFFGTLTFRAEAHTTYYLQVGGLLGQGGPVEFRLEVAPPPLASFGFSPFDPTVLDVVQFLDNSFDPGQVGFSPPQWDFGDGTSGTGSFPTKRYAADGDYVVRLTATTLDGRTASATQTVSVRTHDVAITKFTVPKAASASQTRQVVVGINSRRSLETVEVQLFKSISGGYQQVGSLTQSVPVRSANRTTDYGFSYTFTTADAQAGKVTFKAVANIVSARDALPADNEAIATPTKVNR